MSDHEDPNRIATNESWSHMQHKLFDFVTSLNLSKSVHIGITRQDYKKLAEPAETKSIVRWGGDVLLCNAYIFTIKIR